MKTKILAGLLLAGSTMFAAPRFGFGVSIGAPAPVVVAPAPVAAIPPCPGPGYEFIDGYWQYVGVPTVGVYGGYVGHIDRGHFDRGHFDGGRADHFRR